MSPATREQPSLSGMGLLLRQIEPHEDAPVLHEVFGDAAQLTYMLRKPEAHVGETERLLAGWSADAASPQWAIVSGAVVGRITLVRAREGVYEVGIQVVPSAQGKRVATRAILLATSYAFDHLDACRVFGDVDPGNLPCQRAFVRAGFRREATLIANWKTDGGVFDSVIFAATVGWTAPTP